MRGNEKAVCGECGEPELLFPIPMRGNEMRKGGLKPIPIFQVPDPHEG